MFDNKVSRRNFLKTAGSVSAGFLLNSCAPRKMGLGPHGSNEIQLVYQDWRTDWFPTLASRMLPEFIKNNPSIHVFYTPDPENLTEQLPLDFENGTAPDVLAGCCDFFHEWAQKGYLLDLRPYIQSDLDKSIIDDWSSTQYQSLALKDGLQYAVPKYHGALALFFNKEIFDRYRVDYPDDSWTHEDYASSMNLIRIRNQESGHSKIWPSMIDISWERLQVHINGWGGHFVNPFNNTRSLMGEEEALKAFHWIHDQMWNYHNYANVKEVNNLSTRVVFSKGLLAMVEDGSWALKDILENSPFPLGVTTLPAGPARKVTLATKDGFGIYAGTKYPEAAWELVKFLVGREYGLAMAELHLLQPARASLVEAWVDEIKRQYPSKTKDMDLAAFTRGHIEGYSVTAEMFSNMGAARSLAKTAWEQIFILNTIGVDSIKEISQEIESLQNIQKLR